VGLRQTLSIDISGLMCDICVLSSHGWPVAALKYVPQHMKKTVDGSDF
jgi:hypothetical protein